MATIATTRGVEEADGHFVLNGIGWEQYETVLQAFPEQAGLRITYLDGRVTFLSPTRRHDWASRRLSEIVKAVAAGSRLRWEDSGTTTYRMEPRAAGVEGDDAFYFGEHADQMRGSKDVDLSSQPPPDLVIEVEVTHPADDAVAAWGRIGVSEIWKFDVRRHTVQFLVRLPGGGYEPATHSVAFPELTPNDVSHQVQAADEMGASDWNDRLNGWVREVLMPRRG